MSFVKVETLFEPGRGHEKTVIINTDYIRYIVKGETGVYLVEYDYQDMSAPRFFDRANAEIIFKAIGCAID